MDRIEINRKRRRAIERARAADRKYLTRRVLKTVLLGVLMLMAVSHYVHPDLIACTLGVWALISA